MKILLVTTLLLFVGMNSHAQSHSRIKIYTDQNGINTLYQAGIPVDHGIRKLGKFIITELSAVQIQQVKALNFDYDVLIPDLKKHFLNQGEAFSLKNEVCDEGASSPIDETVPTNFEVSSTYGGFYKYNEILQELDEMAALYPNLISVKAAISTFTTWEGRPLHYVKISDNPNADDNDPMVLYTALHHAREPLGASQLIYFMWYLLENYDTNPEVKFLVDSTQLIFVPCVNPDGYVHNEVTDPNGGGMHRKNMNPNVGSSNPGVDLNRNYGYQWGTTGVSSNENNDTYPGTSAFSEPETQAIRWLVQNMPIRAALNAHTYGDLLLFPIGTTVNEYSDHHDYFQALTNHMVQYNGFTAQKSSGLYPASGDSDDYMYKLDNDVLEKDTIFAMTPEIGNSFWPSSSSIIPVSQSMLFVNFGLAHLVHRFYVVKEDDPSELATITGDFHHQIQKLGRKQGGATVSIEPLYNIVSVGSAVNYDLPILAQDDNAISYSLNPSIQGGDSIVYVLTVDDGEWIQRDTIIKYFAGNYDTLLVENGNNLTNWTGNWVTTTSEYYSPSSSITDSQNDYQNDDSKMIKYVSAIDLTNATTAFATFYAKWDIEADYDYCQFQVSTDNGATWTGQCGLYTNIGSNENWTLQPTGEPLWDGSKLTWVEEKINLSDYLGQTIQVRFLFESDGGLTKDGFYFDDFQILTNDMGGSSAGLLELTSNAIKLFPNPTNHEVHILGLSENVTIQIIDLRGTMIQKQQFNTKTTKLDISRLTSGTYIVRVVGKTNVSNHKLIVE